MAFFWQYALELLQCIANACFIRSQHLSHSKISFALFRQVGKFLFKSLVYSLLAVKYYCHRY